MLSLIQNLASFFLTGSYSIFLTVSYSIQFAVNTNSLYFTECNYLIIFPNNFGVTIKKISKFHD